VALARAFGPDDEEQMREAAERCDHRSVLRWRRTDDAAIREDDASAAAEACEARAC
jgi:hypothetical protein